MRIGFDARMVDWSGVGRYCVNLLRALAEVEPNNEYVLFYNDENRNAIPDAPCFEYVPVNLPGFSPRSIFGFSKYIERADLDVFHAPHFVTPLNVNCPVVVTIHDLIPLMFPQVMPSLARRMQYIWLNRSAMQRADAIIAVSDFTKNEILKRYDRGPDSISVIAEAADPAFAPMEQLPRLPGLKQRFGIDSEYILSFGNLKPSKNIPGLIGAFALARGTNEGSGKAVQLVFVGGKHITNEIRSLAAGFNLEPGAVVIASDVDDAELNELYSGATAFVMPSFLEGFGLPVLEAMACGTPVLCANTSSLPEVAGGAAVMFDPSDVPAMAATITRVLTDADERLRLSELGKVRAKEFSWEKAARLTNSLYCSNQV